MVSVTWDGDTGRLVKVKPADGPGDYTEDVDADKVQSALEQTDSVSEETIAGAVLSEYAGTHRSNEYHVTADTIDETGSLVRTIAFVELDRQEDKYCAMECPACGYSADEARDLLFNLREKNSWVYEDVYCPECRTEIHIELLDMPEDRLIH